MYIKRQQQRYLLDSGAAADALPARFTARLSKAWKMK
jgi:hypothetical protein